MVPRKRQPWPQTESTSGQVGQHRPDHTEPSAGLCKDWPHRVFGLLFRLKNYAKLGDMQNTPNSKKEICLLLFVFPVGTTTKQHESPPEEPCGFFAAIDPELTSKNCISVKRSVLHTHHPRPSPPHPVQTSLTKLSGGMGQCESAVAFTNCLSATNHWPCPGRLRPSAWPATFTHPHTVRPQDITPGRRNEVGAVHHNRQAPDRER